MRRWGVLAAAFAAFAAMGVAALAPAQEPARAPAVQAPAALPPIGVGKAPKLPHNLALQLILSRGHQVMTVLIENRGPGPVCLDPNYGAAARLAAYARAGKPIPSMNANKGASKAPCLRIDPRKTVHVVFDLKPLYPLGLPGASRLCYGASWRRGAADSKAQLMESARCMVLPSTGLGRR
jgi:hypothetical protein